MTITSEFGARVRERIPDALLEAYEDVGMGVLVVEPARVADVLRVLREDAGFDLLSDVSAVDWLPRDPRYDLNYHLYSLSSDARLRVKVRLPDEDHPRVPSVVDVYPGAEWHEREVYDFFGIVFDGHPDLRRILMPDDWVGHPLRKDYAVGGVPVEYKIEPAYVGESQVSAESRPSAGGVPPRLARDRGKPSHWTWTGAPATGVRVPPRPEPPQEEPEAPTQPADDEKDGDA